MPQVTRSAHSTTVSTNLPDNNTGSITPSGHRGVVNDLRDSAVWRNTGIVAPASAPELEGDTYTDTVAAKHYFATGVAAASDYQAVQNELAEGQFVDGDKTKLDGIETGATADQTGAEIKSAYEAEANTNAFTDVEQTKLAGIEAGATADQTGAEIKAAYEGEANTNAFTNAEQAKVAIAVPSDTTGVTGADQITNMISLTQAEYNAISTPDASTFYVIV